MKGQTFKQQTEKKNVKPADPDTTYRAGDHVIVPWGDSNTEPQDIIESIESIGIAGRAIEFNIKSFYGQGPFLYQKEYDENGKEIINPINPEDDLWSDLVNFTKESRINKTSLELITDLEYFYNVFPQYTVSKDFSKITSVRHREAAFCRWTKWDEDQGRVTHCVVSSKWEDSHSLSENEYDVIPVADPFWTVEETKAWCKKNKIYRFIFPVWFPTPGKAYYKKPIWNGARKAGWFDLAAKVPEWKTNVMSNQISIRWVVEIPWDYWDREFPKTTFTNEKERIKKIEERLDEIDEFITAESNAGKTLISHFEVDRQMQKALPGITIKPISKSIDSESGVYLEDSSAANSEILFAFGVDGTLIGAGTPGGKREGGGGSDKREAFFLKTALHKPGRDLISEIWQFAFTWNGFDPKIRVGFKDITFTTLDKNPTGAQKTITT